MSARAAAKQKALCEFVADGHRDDCEVCARKLLPGEHVYWLADGYPSPDGTYVGSCCIDAQLEPTP